MQASKEPIYHEIKVTKMSFDVDSSLTQQTKSLWKNKINQENGLKAKKNPLQLQRVLSKPLQLARN